MLGGGRLQLAIVGAWTQLATRVPSGLRLTGAETSFFLWAYAPTERTIDANMLFSVGQQATLTLLFIRCGMTKARMELG